MSKEYCSHCYESKDYCSNCYDVGYKEGFFNAVAHGVFIVIVCLVVISYMSVMREYHGITAVVLPKQSEGVGK